MREHKSDTITLHVNGEQLAEFIVDRLSVEITRREVLIRGECRNNHEDKVFLNSRALERAGYAPDGSDVPEPVRSSWFYEWGMPITLGAVVIGFFILMFWLQDQPWWN